MLTFELPKFVYFCRTEGYVAQRSTYVAQRSTLFNTFLKKKMTLCQALISAEPCVFENKCSSKVNICSSKVTTFRFFVFPTFIWCYKFQEKNSYVAQRSPPTLLGEEQTTVVFWKIGNFTPTLSAPTPVRTSRFGGTARKVQKNSRAELGFPNHEMLYTIGQPMGRHCPEHCCSTKWPNHYSNHRAALCRSTFSRIWSGVAGE